jgi:hypothetical protein
MISITTWTLVSSVLGKTTVYRPAYVAALMAGHITFGILKDQGVQFIIKEFCLFVDLLGYLFNKSV